MPDPHVHDYLLTDKGDYRCSCSKPYKGRWERDDKWWWWPCSRWVVGIVWVDGGLFECRGIECGPIGIFWERWNRPDLNDVSEENDAD